MIIKKDNRYFVSVKKFNPKNFYSSALLFSVFYQLSNNPAIFSATEFKNIVNGNIFKIKLTDCITILSNLADYYNLLDEFEDLQTEYLKICLKEASKKATEKDLSRKTEILQNPTYIYYSIIEQINNTASKVSEKIAQKGKANLNLTAVEIKNCTQHNVKAKICEDLILFKQGNERKKLAITNGLLTKLEEIKYTYSQKLSGSSYNN